MRYPKRVPEHVKEDLSFRLLQEQTPAIWIIRDVRKNDYGIDCYIEVVPNSGELQGHLISVQLKSTSSVSWRKSGSSESQFTSKLSGIQTTTVNYWMGFQIPVFLTIADLTEMTIYWANVKQQVRRQYSKIIDQDTVTFSFQKDLSLANDLGKLMFVISYHLEREHGRFSSSLRDLIMHLQSYYDLIDNHGWQDPFLEADSRETTMALHLYTQLRFMSKQLALKWDQVPLEARFEEDAATWGYVYAGLLHEQTLGDLLQAMKPCLKEVLHESLELVTRHEKDFWKANERLLWQTCSELKDDLRQSPL